VKGGGDNKMAMQTTLVLQFKDTAGKSKRINIASPVSTLETAKIREAMKDIVADNLIMSGKVSLKESGDPLRKEIGIWVPKAEQTKQPAKA
jgi:hypothetical protein